MRTTRGPLRRLIPLGFFILFFKVGASLHYALLPALGERVLPTAMVGMLIAAEAFGQLLLDVPAGFILDRFGYRRLLGVTTVAFMVTASVLLFGLTPWTFVATVALCLFGWLFFDPGINAYVLSEIPSAFAGRAIALRDMLESAGGVIATAVIAGVLTFRAPTIGLVLLITFLLAAIALTFVPRDRAAIRRARDAAAPHPITPSIPTHHYHIRRSRLPHLLRAFRRLNPAGTLLMLSGFAASTFYGVVWFSVPILIDRTQQSGIPGIGLGIFDAAIVLLGFLFGRLADRWDHRRLVFAGLLLFAIAGTFIGFSVGIWFLVLGFLATSGDETANIALWAWLHRLDTHHADDAAVAGAISMVQDFGWTVGPLMAGLLFNALGPSWTITIGAIPIFLAWIASAIVLHSRPRDTAVPALANIPRLHRRRHKR
ncbi:MFS transporter [Candidatus Uhrbacteria bacterium]|nr:MFS transporter [Candidatus Uhrbacteria bacterium]